MAPTGEHLYKLARKAYETERYRDALTLLDRNWDSICQYAERCELLEWVKQIRSECREILLTRQFDPGHGKRRHRRGKLNPRSKRS
jgi:hypothetical protein